MLGCNLSTHLCLFEILPPTQRSFKFIIFNIYPYIQMVLFCNLIITKINAFEILIIDKYGYFGD
jgi:hypothetical protein